MNPNLPECILSIYCALLPKRQGHFRKLDSRSSLLLYLLQMVHTWLIESVANISMRNYQLFMSTSP